MLVPGKLALADKAVKRGPVGSETFERGSIEENRCSGIEVQLAGSHRRVVAVQYQRRRVAGVEFTLETMGPACIGFSVNVCWRIGDLCSLVYVGSYVGFDFSNSGCAETGISRLSAQLCISRFRGRGSIQGNFHCP